MVRTEVRSLENLTLQNFFDDSSVAIGFWNPPEYQWFADCQQEDLFEKRKSLQKEGYVAVFRVNN